MRRVLIKKCCLRDRREKSYISEYVPLQIRSVTILNRPDSIFQCVAGYTVNKKPLDIHISSTAGV